MCSRDETTLVVFLDDMQWADGATLELLKSIARPGAVPNLQLVLAYRDNEVDASHPLQLAIESLRASGAALEMIAVPALKPQQVTQLVADAVARSSADPQVIDLAALVGAKGGGNPFFITELLYGLDAQGLFHFDVAIRGWTWDRWAVVALEVTDNVVDFLIGRLRKLTAETRRALAVASCFGNEFTLGHLAFVLELPVDSVANLLFVGLEESFILRAGDGIAEARSFRFHHDRIQQASYTLLPDPDRASVHLRIGRLLRTLLAAGADDTGFDVVKHLNQAAPLITDPAERQELVALNLAASQRAKKTIAWESARLFLETARSLLPADAWTLHYDTVFAITRELAECEFLTGNFPASERLFEEVRHRATSRTSRAEVATLQIRLYVL